MSRKRDWRHIQTFEFQSDRFGKPERYTAQVYIDPKRVSQAARKAMANATRRSNAGAIQVRIYQR